MVWAAVVVVLLLLAAAVWVPLGMSVYRKAMSLFDEAGRAGERFAEVAERLEQASAAGGTSRPVREDLDLAVFADAWAMRAERSRRGVGRHRAEPVPAGRSRRTSRNGTYDDD